MADQKTRPHDAQVGDRIEHELLPGFVMDVQATRACEQDPARPKVHLAYQVTDPEGATDWLCAYDVRPAVTSG